LIGLSAITPSPTQRFMPAVQKIFWFWRGLRRMSDVRAGRRGSYFRNTA
jgi:hypothetical protein